MNLAQDTGRTEERACKVCGKVLTHRETEVSGYGMWWHPGPHAAPCGRPRIGGGVPSAQFHDAHRKECCKTCLQKGGRRRK